MTPLAQTTKQRIREHRDQQVVAEYQAYRNAYPEAPAAQLIRTIALSGKFNLSEPGLKRILYRTGAIKPVKRS